MNNEINNNNNEVSNNTNNMENTYTLLIASRDKGHDTLMLDLEKTVDTVISTVEQKKSWVFINGAPFHFAGSNVRTVENQQNLRTVLESNPMAQIMLTGQVIGGQAVLS